MSKMACKSLYSLAQHSIALPDGQGKKASGTSLDVTEL